MESDPNRRGTLCRDLVKGKRGKQANNGFRHTFRYFRVRVVFDHVGIWKCVDSTSRPIVLALPVETNKILPR